MDDLISRQVAIDAILTEVDEIDMPNVESRWWNMGMMRASKILEHLPSAQQWIPCSERLPEEGKEVLISTNGSIYTAEFDLIDGNVQWYDTVECRRLAGVVAWMPLPEPYKGREDE